MNRKKLRINLILIFSSIIVFGLLCYSYYIYINPYLASKELYALEKKQQEREKQMSSFSIALDNFDKQTNNSNGKAVMSLLNIPLASPEELPKLEYDIKSKELKKIIWFAIILFVNIAALFMLKNNKKREQ